MGVHFVSATCSFRLTRLVQARDDGAQPKDGQVNAENPDYTIDDGQSTADQAYLAIGDLAQSFCDVCEQRADWREPIVC